MRMWHRICAFATLICTVLACSGAQADYQSSSTWFNGLGENERELLQSRLILTGFYFALADGEFGPRTYKAILGLQERVGERPTGVLSAKASEVLNNAAAEVFQDLGMDITEDSRGQLTLFVPHALLSEQTDTKRGTAYYSPADDIRLETIRKSIKEQSFEDLYRSLSASSRDRRVTYSVFGQARFVVSGTRGHRSFYMLFRNTGTDSVGYSLEWEQAENAHGSMLATFLASYSYPSALDDSLTDEDFAGRTPSGAEPNGTPTKPTITSGSGFFVSQEGLIVTNHHVVDGCATISITNHGTARVITSDENLDLALLRTDSAKATSWARIRGEDVELGESVILLGYPLSHLLNSSLSIGTGIVSSEAGLGGIEGWFTSNVGVQPGNSGGPIVDAFGEVVGVAVAKLDDSVMMAESGNTAPNFGFAIKNTELIEFLSIFRTDGGKTSRPKKNIGERLQVPSVSDVVEVAREYTVQVVCRQ